MGIHIHLYVSKSVTKQEWKDVYEESLFLAKAFPLADLKEINIKGVDTICFVPSHEYEKSNVWRKDIKRIGWCTSCDYETLDIAEDYFTPKDLIEDKEFNKDAVDAIFGAIPLYNNFEYEDIYYNQIYHLWGNKTQGKPYHMFLLAIACMIESRLGEKAFVAGDITRGQCRKAVEIANKYLEKSIEMPDRCNMEQLYKRIVKLPLSSEEHLNVFVNLYLGTKDAEFGKYLRRNFSEAVCYEYWKNRFNNSYIETIGFDENIKDYLLWGFDLEKLFNLVNYYDKNNQPQYEMFITKILDSKLHLKEKNCKDLLEIDQEDESPYTVDHLFAQFIYSGSRNRKIDRYIPIGELREILQNSLREKCDVQQIITEYLYNESLEKEIDFSKEQPTTEEELAKLQKQDSAAVFQEVMKVRQQKLYEKYNEYDIFLPEKLEYYKKGDSIYPELKDSLTKLFKKYTESLEKDTFLLLKEQSAYMQFKCLTTMKQEIILRDKDWEKIFNNLKNDKESIKRYYMILYLKISDDRIYHIVKAIMLNDDLYNYLVENYEMTKLC